jgi:hypothetical protein
LADVLGLLGPGVVGAYRHTATAPTAGSDLDLDRGYPAGLLGQCTGYPGEHASTRRQRPLLAPLQYHQPLAARPQRPHEQQEAQRNGAYSAQRSDTCDRPWPSKVAKQLADLIAQVTEMYKSRQASQTEIAGARPAD